MPSVHRVAAAVATLVVVGCAEGEHAGTVDIDTVMNKVRAFGGLRVYKGDIRSRQSVNSSLN